MFKNFIESTLRVREVVQNVRLSSCMWLTPEESLAPYKVCQESLLIAKPGITPEHFCLCPQPPHQLKFFQRKEKFTKDMFPSQPPEIVFFKILQS